MSDQPCSPIFVEVDSYETGLRFDLIGAHVIGKAQISELPNLACQLRQRYQRCF